MDLMQNPGWKQVVTDLFQDQGLSAPGTFEVDISMIQADWIAATWYLADLTPEQRTTFTIGEHEEMSQMVEKAEYKEGAEAAHLIIDTLFETRVF